MRLKRSRVKTYHLKTAVPSKDGEGNSYVTYGLSQSFDAEMWAAGGKVQSMMYGQRLPNIRNIRVEGCYTETSNDHGSIGYMVSDIGLSFSVGDGICLFVGPDQEPDYRIIAIYPYHFLTMEVERI